MTTLMKNFIEAVKMMREYQKEYFRTRSNDILVASKQAEKRVDALLADFDTLNLFDN